MPLLLAACTGGGSGGVAPTPTPVIVTKDTCVDLVYRGRHLGVTAPTGFTLDLNPESQEDKAVDAAFGGLHFLAEMYLEPLGPENRTTDPDAYPVRTVYVDVYANGPGDSGHSDRGDLAYIILRFAYRVGGGSVTGDRVDVAPITIDGGRGGIGSTTDPRALGASDSVPAQLHWWTVPVGDSASGVQFTVGMVAKTKAVDAQYKPVIQDGLHIGGCTTPRTK